MDGDNSANVFNFNLAPSASATDYRGAKRRKESEKKTRVRMATRKLEVDKATKKQAHDERGRKLAESAAADSLRRDDRDRDLDRDSIMQDDDNYDILRQEIHDLKKQIVDLSGAHANSRRELQGHQAENKAKDDAITALTNKNNELENKFVESRQTINHLNQSSKDVDGHLNKAYADLEASNAGRKAAIKAKDDADARCKEKSIEVASLQGHLVKAQTTINNLASTSSALEQLERDNKALQAEIDNNSDVSTQHDQEIAVKDARIQRLETELQKALQGKLSAEAAIADAQAPTAAPQIPHGDESLESELAGLSDSEFVDVSSTFEQLEVSEIHEIASQVPVPAVPLHASTQTEASDKTISGIHSIIEIAPEDTMSIVQTPPQFLTSVQPVPTVATSKKQSVSKFLAALLLFLVILFWKQQFELSRNDHGYYARSHHSRYGAFGQGRYLLGVFPVGFDIGHSEWSERLCAYMSRAILSFEEWAGSTPTPMY
ncbi:hypothetical protein P280DRAFT_524980 [Massarina eburnea CBS 473.64]|uniref:Uncharacterized protein n=1 Tax=Massarina eburnea CBS 473.64 TaxID=1395130 RepID=A0A6A6SJ65_9PLEO|nr:hypothetical protein P280DRAFT_524980 [Massarina eburnea CBS 473.64]